MTDNDDRSFIENMISRLKQERDELAVQIHLGKQEAKEEWDKVQEKLQKVADDFDPVKDAVEESASNVFQSLKLVGEEIVESFGRIRSSITEE